jgi:glycosyltransferase involved in cell wall biosynthesis
MEGLEWWMYRKADAIVTLSPGARAGVLQREVSPEKVHLLPAAGGVLPANAPSFPWRPDGVGVADFLVVVPTSNDHTQDLDIVLDAAVELRRRGEHDLRVVLVGVREGRAGLERRVREEHLHAVVFAPALSAEERPALLAGADVGLITAANIPSFYQGLPWPVFYECLAAGLPVVTNLPGWHGEAIEDARCGYTTLPNQPKLLADALQQAKKAGRQARQTLGQRARTLGQQLAPESSHYQKELELLEELGGKAGKAG